MKQFIIGCVAVAMALTVVGCKKEKTTSEKVADGLSSAWSATKNAAKDAADATSKAAKKAADATADAAKKAADAVK